MLRGVFGAALHDVSAEAYGDIFTGRGPPHLRRPLYILRSSVAGYGAFEDERRVALDLILIGHGAALVEVVDEAWVLAAKRGLGPHRVPFRIAGIELLTPNGDARPYKRTLADEWTLDEAVRTAGGANPSQPCTAGFPTPLRLHRDGEVILRPDFPDLALAAARRVREFLDDPLSKVLASLDPDILEQARTTPRSEWSGVSSGLRRYSATQQKEFSMEGVTGVLLLPNGPGGLWPLLVAAEWLHIGKGTVFGMGRLVLGAAR